jgi:hypothetical protein
MDEPMTSFTFSDALAPRPFPLPLKPKQVKEFASNLMINRTTDKEHPTLQVNQIRSKTARLRKEQKAHPRKERGTPTRTLNPDGESQSLLERKRQHAFNPASRAISVRQWFEGIELPVREVFLVVWGWRMRVGAP